MIKANNNSKWLAAEEAYDDPEGSKKQKSGKAPQQAVSNSKKEAKLRVSNPAILRHNPYVRPNHAQSTLGKRSKVAQDQRLFTSYEHRLSAVLAFIPTFNAPVPLAELKSWAKSDEELQRVVPIIRDLEENGKVIACSTRVVDPLTGQTMFLYLADRYGDDREHYENDQSLGDPALGFKKPEWCAVREGKKDCCCRVAGPINGRFDGNSKSQDLPIKHLLAMGGGTKGE
ncbi:hypothetical protein B0H14DRAFT_3150424 [Mycena olivaceomarginata]|nr:hypothetical protein B0H14DRAFT_3150424 [Mycena olivaceomarginata]